MEMYFLSPRSDELCSWSAKSYLREEITFFVANSSSPLNANGIFQRCISRRFCAEARFQPVVSARKWSLPREAMKFTASILPVSSWTYVVCRNYEPRHAVNRKNTWYKKYSTEHTLHEFKSTRFIFRLQT